MSSSACKVSRRLGEEKRTCGARLRAQNGRAFCPAQPHCARARCASPSQLACVTAPRRARGRCVNPVRRGHPASRGLHLAAALRLRHDAFRAPCPCRGLCRNSCCDPGHGQRALCLCRGPCLGPRICPERPCPGASYPGLCRMTYYTLDALLLRAVQRGSKFATDFSLAFALAQALCRTGLQALAALLTLA